MRSRSSLSSNESVSCDRQRSAWDEAAYRLFSSSSLFWRSTKRFWMRCYTSHALSNATFNTKNDRHSLGKNPITSTSVAKWMRQRSSCTNTNWPRRS